jgi:transposase
MIDVDLATGSPESDDCSFISLTILTISRKRRESQFVYPAAMRSTRDLLRRRMHLMRQRAELLGHIQITDYQYNLPDIGKKIAYKANREGVAERFADASVQSNVALDLKLIDAYDGLLRKVELEIVRQAKDHDAQAYHLSDSVPGIGKILSLVILHEVQDIGRFPRVQDFVSYCRLVKAKNESAGKNYGTSGNKIGNAHLKWAFSEAAVLFLKDNPAGQAYVARLERKHDKGKHSQSWPTNSLERCTTCFGARRLST